jgi:hypothetical protein
MRNSNTRARCNKKQLSKAKGVVRTYNDLQDKFADMLQTDDSIKEFICNYPLTDFPIAEGKYTTDFYCTTVSGEIVVYECVFRKHITKPLTVKLLDESRNYWLKRGADWRLVIDAEK